MKVYVMTKAEIFESEIFIGVKNSWKAAEKELRNGFPYMKKDSLGFEGKGENGVVRSYIDNNSQLLLFIHEIEV